MRRTLIIVLACLTALGCTGAMLNSAFHTSVVIGGGPGDANGGLQIEDTGTLTTTGTILTTGNIYGARVRATSTPFEVAYGGTGGTTAATARTNLGLGTIATQAASAVTVTGGSINGTTLGSSVPAAAKFTTLEASGYVMSPGGTISAGRHGQMFGRLDLMGSTTGSGEIVLRGKNGESDWNTWTLDANDDSSLRLWFTDQNSTAFTSSALAVSKTDKTATFGGTVKAPAFQVTALNAAPASATATGTTGEIRWTSGYVYLCTATNTWRRAALTAW